MKKIFKYELEATGLQEVEMPKGAKILSTKIQYGRIYIWALVDEDNTTQKKTILLAGTGHPISSEHNLKFIGTVQGGQFVWHIFEKKEKPEELDRMTDKIEHKTYWVLHTGEKYTQGSLIDSFPTKERADLKLQQLRHDYNITEVEGEYE